MTSKKTKIVDVSGNHNQDVGNRESIHHSRIGQVNGGSVIHGDVHQNDSSDKDRIIEKRESDMEKMFKVLIDEMHRHYNVSMMRDQYTEKQDAYLRNIMKSSYLRNERNMERLDRALELQAQLINASIADAQETRSQMARLIELLEKRGK